jgi:hypothetical protein
VGDNTAGKRAAAYWFSDGLPDILAGLAYLLFGLVWSWIHVAAIPGWAKLVLVLPVMALHGVVLFSKDRAILEFFKARTTYRRTGYARPPEDERWQRRDTMLHLFPAKERPGSANVSGYGRRTVLVVWWAAYIGAPPEVRAGGLFTTVLMAAALYVFNRKTEHPCDWRGLLPLAVSGALLDGWGWHPVEWEQRMGPLMVLGGAWLLARGVWMLVLYWRRSPAPAAERA